MNNKKYITSVFIIVTLILSAFGIYYFTKSAQEKQNIKTSASVNGANVFFTPNNEILPGDKMFKLFITAGASVGFVDVEITFDKNLIKLSDEVVINQPSLATVIEKTSKVDANNNGRIKIIVAVDPAHRDNPPSGTFDLVDIKFSINTQSSNINTSVSVDTSSSQIVALDSLATNYVLTTEPLSLSLNPVVATSNPTTPPQATEIPTENPTMTPTSIATATSVATAVATSHSTSLPTATSSANITGDVNGDGYVNMVDIGIIVENYLSDPILDLRADVDGDGYVNMVDIGIVVDNYGV